VQKSFVLLFFTDKNSLASLLKSTKHKSFEVLDRVILNANGIIAKESVLLDLILKLIIIRNVFCSLNSFIKKNFMSQKVQKRKHSVEFIKPDLPKNQNKKETMFPFFCL
jgi:hypothetical protein